MTLVKNCQTLHNKKFLIQYSKKQEITAERNMTGAERRTKITEILTPLTGGLHIHTISVPDENSYGRIVAKLSALGILADGVSE